MAGTTARNRQLTGIINPDDRFQAASSADRMSSCDPPQTLKLRHSIPQETSLRERILAGFEVENAWRTEHLGASEPSVSSENGVRGDIDLRAGFNWRPTSSSAKKPPDSALVYVTLDAGGADEDFLHWLLGEGDYTFVYLVTPVETARHLPEKLQYNGRTVVIRRFGWTRELEYDRFDPLALAVWHDLAGPSLALRVPVPALKRAAFKRPTGGPKRRS